MPRIDPTVSKQAEEIYKSLPQGERGKFVSDAIIEKHEHKQGTSLQQQIDELTKRVEELERMGKK